jgi:hypothetical protein
VRLRNYGPVRWASLPLTVTADKRVVLEQKVNLGPDSTAAFRVGTDKAKGIVFADAGTHVVSAAVNRQPPGQQQQQGATALKPTGFTLDDGLDAVVDVIEPIKVLVVSGDEGRANPDSDKSADRGALAGGEADYLRVALGPYKAAKRDGVDLCAVDVVPPEAWAGPTVALPKRSGSPAREARLGSWQVVVLANVGRLDPGQVVALEQFVYDGGGLLVAPGNLVAADEYNDWLYRGGAGLLPAALLEPTSDDGYEQTTLSGFDPQHPVFRFLGGRPDPFLPAVIGRYFPVDRRAPASASRPTTRPATRSCSRPGLAAGGCCW